MTISQHPSYLVGQHLSDYDFNLPQELIAQYPLEDRTASRLLHVTTKTLEDLHFRDIEKLLRPGDLLVMNNTRVIKARLRGKKESGGAVEALIERVLTEHDALSMLRASKTPKTDGKLFFENAEGERAEAVVMGRQGEFFKLHFEEPVFSVLDRFGKVPLPPYIEREAAKEDEGRYQTVYAARPGAVAAPTAGLHFTKELLERLAAKGIEEVFVTLHVGAGTFQPVREENLEEHTMHSEICEITPEVAEKINRAKSEGRRVIAVGSTSLRTIESAADRAGHVVAGTLDTRLFIAPGYLFKITDVMITNFHLPKSTLVMLVSAIVGRDRVLEAYQHAIDERYRFFSYGDACFFEVPDDAKE